MHRRAPMPLLLLGQLSSMSLSTASRSSARRPSRPSRVQKVPLPTEPGIGRSRRTRKSVAPAARHRGELRVTRRSTGWRRRSCAATATRRPSAHGPPNWSLVMNSMTSMASGSLPLNRAARSPPLSDRLARSRPRPAGSRKKSTLAVEVLLDLVGEEGGDEVPLPVQEAAGRVVEHRVRRGAEGVLTIVLRPTEDVAVGEGQLCELLGRLLDDAGR